MSLHSTTVTQTVVEEKCQNSKHPMVIVWSIVILFCLLHLGAAYGVYLIFTSATYKTTAFAYLLYLSSLLGVSSGVHRLWSHRSYKAKLPLRIILAFFNTIAFQNHIYEWARDHRQHHKYSETDADPHNAKRGFFFSHMGWLLVRKHPEVIAKRKTLDLSDLEADPVVRFQRKYYVPLVIFCCFLMPTLVPVVFWGENIWNAFFVCSIFRYCFFLHTTWTVNSAAHMWGNRPYDRYINPRDNLFLILGATGEGFHNYHHTFPWDYSSSEFGWTFNISTIFIDIMAWIGWAYDRKSVTPEVIRQRRKRTGDKADSKSH